MVGPPSRPDGQNGVDVWITAAPFPNPPVRRQRILPVFGVRSMESVVAQTFAQRTFQLRMIAAFTAVALLPAALGIYGVTSFQVHQ
jgi:hypothetical protein